MSLDIWLENKKCPACGHSSERKEFNSTYNLSCMWYNIFPDDDKFVDIDGMTGKESLKRLLHAKQILIERKSFFEKMNPENGWGSYDGFCKFIKDLIESAQENPKLIWRSWR